MIVEAVDPETGKSIQMDCTLESESEIRDLLSFELSEEALKKRIDGLDISADTKSILFTISKTTFRVGSTIVKIGRKVLDLVATVLTEFPMTSSGVIFGVIFGYLVSSIPLIGMLFGPFVAALSIAFGFGIGAMHDLSNKALERRIKASMSSFAPLNPKA